MTTTPRQVSLTLATLLAASTAAATMTTVPADAAAPGWRVIWAASPQRPGTSFIPNWSEQGFADQTVRQVVRISAGGAQARIRLSNAYGTTPLKVAGATIALTAEGAAVRPKSLRHLTVNRTTTFTIPAGTEVASDPVALPLAALDSVTITLYLAEPTGPATYHSQATTTSYLSAGDHRADTGAAPSTEISQSWYYISGIDVTGRTPRRPGVVAFGDSHTDGVGSTLGANNRYPDQLAERLSAAGRPRAVVNEGIGGNRVTVDSALLGDKATSRFQRDVLGQPGIGTVIILEGINDIGVSEAPIPVTVPHTEVSAEEIIAGYQDLIRQARAKDLRVIGGTLPPMKGSPFYTARSEAKRREVNAWIRTSGKYDAVADFDRALASPSDKAQLNPAYDSGDHLHLNDAGYQAMAHAVDLDDLR